MDLDSFASMLASQMNRPAVPIRQQLDTLKRLGIRLTPKQEEGFFLSQSARYEDPAYAAILTELGAADSDQVYAFDAEVTQRSTMYRDLIGALLRLTGRTGPPRCTRAARTPIWRGLAGHGGVSFYPEWTPLPI